jgi:hypothetical protein
MAPISVRQDEEAPPCLPRKQLLASSHEPFPMYPAFSLSYHSQPTLPTSYRPSHFDSGTPLAMNRHRLSVTVSLALPNPKNLTHTKSNSPSSKGSFSKLPYPNQLVDIAKPRTTHKLPCTHRIRSSSLRSECRLPPPDFPVTRSRLGWIGTRSKPGDGI